MIAVSGALVLVAIALLVTGLALPSLVFVYASIGMSLVSAGCLVVGLFAGRGRLFRRGTPATAGAARADGGPAAARTRSGTVGATKAGGGQAGGGRMAGGGQAGGGRTAPERGGRTAATGLAEAPADAEVVVLPGRPRYHLASCRLVKGRATEMLVLAEAREEGYVACTACRPDAALAARGGRDENDAAPEGAAAEGAAPQGETPEGDPGTEMDAAAEEPAAGPADAAEVVEAPGVVVVPGQRRYHRSGCAVVADAVADGTETATLSPAEAVQRGLTPCTACHPPAG